MRTEMNGIRIGFEFEPQPQDPHLPPQEWIMIAEVLRMRTRGEHMPTADHRHVIRLIRGESVQVGCRTFALRRGRLEEWTR